MLKGVSTLADHAVDIAASSKAQSTGLAEINMGVAHVDTTTKQNAAMAEEVTSSIMSIRGDAAELLALLQTFKMPDGGHDSNGAHRQADPKYAGPGSTREAVHGIPSRGQVVAMGKRQ
ncbi:MAG: hypothetical protein H7317_11050 [Pseudorhodobacter sp.]|nr:hypothetical protein [Pseudorhodobacter sp.]